MIRAGKLSDCDRAVELLRDSRLGAGFDNPNGISGFVFPFVEEDAAQLFVDYLAAPRRLCLIHDVNDRPEGLLLAHAYKHDFGPVWLSQERLWWIDPAHRGMAAVRMLEAYEAWSSEQGCKFGGMAGMGDDPEVAKLYLRRGYVAAEKNFLKAL